MKNKLPHARVVTGDGPILGAVRTLWADATESVVECLEAAAKVHLVREEEAQIRETFRRRRIDRLEEAIRPGPAELLNKILALVNDAMRRNKLHRQVLEWRRSELACSDSWLIRCLRPGKHGTFRVEISDVQMAYWAGDGRYAVVGHVADVLIKTPCPRCVAFADRPDNVTLGED